MPRAERRCGVRYAVTRCTALFRRKRLVLLWEKEPHHAPVVDMSSHGISFVTKRTLAVGDIVRIALDMAMPYELTTVPPGFEIRAKVEWMASAPGEPGLKRVGCSFHRLKKMEREIITRLIRFGILRER